MNTPGNENYGLGMGKWVSDHTGNLRPMGSWTGLPPVLGAPLSGALIGAGLGGVYGLGKRVLNGVEEEEIPWWRKPWVVGLGAGAGLGLASGLSQTFGNQPLQSYDEMAKQKAGHAKKAYASPNSVIRVIMNDPNIAHYEKTRLVNLVEAANPSQLKQLLAMAVAGSLTAAAAHSIVGTGFFGSTLIGGITALATKGLMPRPTRYI